MNTPPVNALSDENPAPANQAGVGLLKKTFQILDLFIEEHPSWTQAELVRETGLSRSTLGRLVRFLCARGYLLEQRGRYTLGFAAVDLGRRAQLQFFSERQMPRSSRKRSIGAELASARMR